MINTVIIIQFTVIRQSGCLLASLALTDCKSVEWSYSSGAGCGVSDLKGLVHEAFLLSQGLPVLLHLLHAAPHLHACIFFIKASLPQLTHLAQ